jgi:hypothetical protein
LYGTSDDGERIQFDSGGQPVRTKTYVAERSADGKIKRATGPLTALDNLKKQGAFVEARDHIIAVREQVPPVTVRMEIGEEVARGVLKIALHFVAGFIGDIESRVAQTLLPFVSGSLKPLCNIPSRS